MKNCLKIMMALLVLAPIPARHLAFGQAIVAGQITLDADYAAFRIEGDTARDFVEIYYDLHRSQLKYEPADTGYVAYIDLKLSIKDDSGNLLDTLSWTRASGIEKLSSLQNSDFLISDLVQYVMKVGRYAIDLYVSNGGQAGHTSFSMEAPAFGLGGPEISNLELAYQIEPESTGVFVKGGYRVLPNPSGQFMHDNKVVYLYAEGYNLDTTATADTSYSITMEILNIDGQVVKAIPGSAHRKPGESAVIRTGFSIATFKAGQYVLRVTLTDGAKSASKTKNFAVIGVPEIKHQISMRSLLQDFPEADRIASQEDAAKFRNDIIYIAIPDELKLFDSLNLTGKANFQKDFWDRRNPDPSNPVNALEVEHYRRLKHANEAFGTPAGFTPGWKTDRGRVYILYGEPSYIEQHPSSIGARSWEQWWYNGLEGGVYFVFVDFENADQYTLIHSTKKNEVRDDNWDRKIRMTLDDNPPGTITGEQNDPGLIGR